jgi:hypothetical protein
VPHSSENLLLVERVEQLSRSRKAIQQPLKEGHAGVGDGRIVLIGDSSVVAEDLAFFGRDQSEQRIDGRETGDPALVVFFLDIAGKLFRLEVFDRLEHFEIMLHRSVE